MKNILTFGGSNSKNSISRSLAIHLGEMMKECIVENIDLNDYELPLYSIDRENEFGFPDNAIELNNKLTQTDGLIIVLAEHNGAYSAVFKNLFDWLSRIDGEVWKQKPMLLLSTSPGVRGGQSVLDIAKSRFPRNGGNIVGSMPFPSFNDNFRNGEIVNSDLESKVISLLDSFNSQL
ncbi:MAG: NAD(P)H-dependent oxidoreductase [Lutimonas sp.]